MCYRQSNSSYLSFEVIAGGSIDVILGTRLADDRFDEILETYLAVDRFILGTHGCQRGLRYSRNILVCLRDNMILGTHFNIRKIWCLEHTWRSVEAKMILGTQPTVIGDDVITMIVCGNTFIKICSNVTTRLLYLIPIRNTMLLLRLQILQLLQQQMLLLLLLLLLLMLLLLTATVAVDELVCMLNEINTLPLMTTPKCHSLVGIACFREGNAECRWQSSQ